MAPDGPLCSCLRLCVCPSAHSEIDTFAPVFRSQPGPQGCLAFPLSLFVTPFFSGGMESLICLGCCNTTTSVVVTPLWAADQQQRSTSHCPGGWKSKLKALAHSGSAESSLPGSQTVMPPGPCTAEGREELYTWDLFYKSINPCMEAPPS